MTIKASTASHRITVRNGNLIRRSVPKVAETIQLFDVPSSSTWILEARGNKAIATPTITTCRKLDSDAIRQIKHRIEKSIKIDNF